MSTVNNSTQIEFHMEKINKEYNEINNKIDYPNAEYKAAIEKLKGNSSDCLSKKIEIYEKWSKCAIKQNEYILNLNKELELSCIKHIIIDDSNCCNRVKNENKAIKDIIKTLQISNKLKGSSEIKLLELRKLNNNLKAKLKTLEIKQQNMDHLPKYFEKKIFNKNLDTDSAIESSFSSDVDEK